MKKLITLNLWLKLLSLLLAMALWFLCINITDPISQDSYTVPVQVKNMKTMNNMGKYVELADGNERVRVTVKGTRSVLSTFSPDNIVVTADLTKINDNNQVPIEITSTKASDKIDSITTEKKNINVNVENINRLQLPIGVVVENEPAEGYILGSTGTSQNVVIISGPASEVEQVKAAKVEINVAEAKSDVNISLPIHLYGEDDEILDVSKITLSKSEVNTTATILETKKIKINVIAEGTPIDNYIVSSVKAEPEEITVAGKGNALKSISAININDVLNVSGIVGDITKEADIKSYLPEGISFIGQSSTILLSASVQPEGVLSVSLKPENVYPTNIPEGYTVKINPENDFNIEIRGEQMMLTTLDPASLVGVLDIEKYMEENEIEELEAGEILVPLEINLPENTRIAGNPMVVLDINK